MNRKIYEILGVLGVMIFVVFVSACNQNVQIEEAGDIDRMQHDFIIADVLISSEIVDVSPEKVVIKYINNAENLDVEWSYEPGYRLERLVADGTWEAIPFAEAFNEMPWPLFVDGLYTNVYVDLNFLHGYDLDAGTYLITRRVIGEPRSENEAFYLSELNHPGLHFDECGNAIFYVYSIFKID